MAYRLKDFQDIIDFVMEEMKHNENDTVNINRIKRDINAIYINEVAPIKRWRWLTKHTAVVHPAYYGSGTVSVTPNSTTITFSTAPSTSKAGHYFAVDSYSEIYTISAHEADSTSATLTTAYTGTLDDEAAFKTWIDKIALPTDARETVEVWHDFGNPLDGVGQQEIRKHIQKGGARLTGRASYYSTTDFYDPTSDTGETEADRYRQLQLYPALYSTPTTYKIDYIQEVTELDSEGDEPLMPIEDRIVLAYGAVARAWRRERNDQASMLNQQLFQKKLDQMCGKVEDSQDSPQFTTSSKYMAAKKGSRFRSIPSSMGSGGGSSYQIPTYLEDTTINGANITGNVTVTSSITIDGRDVSVDGATLDAHLVDTSDAHDASAISVSPSGNLVSTDVQSALVEIQTELDSALDILDLAAHTNDAEDAHDASAISFTPAGTVAATEVQAAIEEVSTDAASALTTHEADTSTHGVTTVAGLDEVQTFTNKTLTSPVINTPTGIVKGDVGLGNVDNTSDANKPVSTDQQTALDLKADLTDLSDHEADTSTHGVTTVAGLSETQTFSAKTFSDAVKIAEIATPATPASGFGAIYFKSDGKLYQLNDDGTETQVGAGGGGGVNHLSANPDAESGTTGYATFADAAGTSPVDGTGGSANVTWTRTTSSPLRSTGSFLLTKDAADRQGEGVSYDFTIGRADRYTVHTIKFNYEVASGTYADNDVTVWIYDVTNATLIQPVGYQLKNATINATHQATFQTTDSTSYRLIFHVSSTSASAYTIKMDDLSVGPQSIARGPTISDPISFTPTGTWTGANATYTGKKWRVGNRGFYEVEIALTGAPTVSGDLEINMPSGETIDTAAWPAGSAHSSHRLGNATLWDATTENHFGVVTYTATNKVRVRHHSTYNGNVYLSNQSATSATAPFTFATGDKLRITWDVPILGWSSNQVLSSEEDGRVCSARYTTVTGQTNTTGSTAILNYNVADFDTHAAVTTGASWKFTAPLPGKYRVTAGITCDAATTTSASRLELYKNGSLHSLIDYRVTPSTTRVSGYGSGAVNLVAGDYIDVRWNNGDSATRTLITTVGYNSITVTRESGPSQISSAETITAAYHLSANFAASTTTPINFDTKEQDSHGAVVPHATTWKFTAPISGVYSVSGFFMSSSGNVSLQLYKGGVAYKMLGHSDPGGSTRGPFSSTVPLLAGEYIDLRPNGASTVIGGTKSTAGVANVNIVRVGNYA